MAAADGPEQLGPCLLCSDPPSACTESSAGTPLQSVLGCSAWQARWHVPVRHLPAWDAPTSRSGLGHVPSLTSASASEAPPLLSLAPAEMRGARLPPPPSLLALPRGPLAGRLTPSHPPGLRAAAALLAGPAAAAEEPCWAADWKAGSPPLLLPSYSAPDVLGRLNMSSPAEMVPAGSEPATSCTC